MGIPNSLLEDMPSNNYINIVDEELQHLFNFNFGVLVCGIRVIFKKVMFLVTGLFLFPIFVTDTIVNDVKKSGF